MRSTIAPREVSIVVQGPIVGRPSDPPRFRLTNRCLESLRRHMPDAEIVLSTYKNSILDGLTYDVLVESADPGGHVQNDELGVWNNTNRQIVTTMAGLRSATRRFAVKTRSDVLMTGSRWLCYFGKFTKRSKEWAVFNQRVLSCTVYARNPSSAYCYPYHPSDWFFFGERDDLQNLWDIPLQPEPETSRWFASHPRPERDVVPSNLMRYTPEQYLWITFLRKYGTIRFEHCHDYEHGAGELTQLTFANNLVLLEPSQLQLRFLKYPISYTDRFTLFTYGDWLRMYRQHCDPSYVVYPDWTKLRRRILAGPVRKCHAIAGAIRHRAGV